MIQWRPTPRLWTLPLLWVIWCLVAQSLLLASLLYGKWDAPQQMKDMRWMLDPMLWKISGVSALVLGSLHFSLWKSGLWRRRTVKLTTTLLATLIGTTLVLLALEVRKNYYRGAGLSGVYRMDDYEQLANSGQFDEMVRRMEEDCAHFNKAKEKMDGKIGFHTYGHGYSYLFVSIHPAWDSSVSRLAPSAVLATLETARYFGHDPPNLGGYGEWRPLAERVRKSDTPILKSLGAYMLDDMDGFASAAYTLADHDPDALALAAFASLKDPIPSRAIERMLRYQSMEAYKTFPYYVCVEVEDDHDVMGAVVARLKASTIQGLDTGTLDEPLKARLREHPWAHELPENYRRLLEPSE